MKEIFYNNDNLKESDIDKTVIRVKALIINSNNEILLGYSDNTYQFPGGHLNESEELLTGLFREVKEETGIVLTGDYKPFMKISYYSKNYRDTLENRENIIYYYAIKTDELYNLDNTNYDSYEIEHNYSLLYVKLNEIKKLLIDSIPDNKINETIVNEMLLVLTEYKNLGGNYDE